MIEVTNPTSHNNGLIPCVKQNVKVNMLTLFNDYTFAMTIYLLVGLVITGVKVQMTAYDIHTTSLAVRPPRRVE